MDFKKCASLLHVSSSCMFQHTAACEKNFIEVENLAQRACCIVIAAEQAHGGKRMECTLALQ